MLMGQNIPSTLRGTLWYMFPIRLCIIWFMRPICILAQFPLLVMRGDWMVGEGKWIWKCSLNKCRNEFNLIYPI
jgi:hypothetical protein